MKNNLRKYFTVILFFVLFSIINFNSSFAIEPESKILYQGIDVSGWQGKIDYGEVKRSGIDIVYIKSSEGTSIDPYFYLNYNNAKENGLKIGVYHYVIARSVEDANAEALFFVNLVKDKSIDCKLAMDFESFNGLSNDEINNIAYEFLKVVEENFGKEVIIYSDLSRVEELWDKRIYQNYKLWLAFYNDYNLIDNLNLSWENWIGNQYTDEGKVLGIESTVDRDYYTEDIFYIEENVLPFSKIQNETEENYLVKKGDTLYLLAKRFNTTIENIARENDIENVNLIYVGENLKIIPNYNQLDLASSTSKKYYKVKKGDYLYKIAKMYDVSLEKIVRLNNISNPNLIYPNEILKIPN